jgi:hypothetical protein
VLAPQTGGVLVVLDLPIEVVAQIPLGNGAPVSNNIAIALVHILFPVSTVLRDEPRSVNLLFKA